MTIFTDGSADVAFDEAKSFGFDNKDYGGYFLAEDEYTPFDQLSGEDESYIGLSGLKISPPTWNLLDSAAFEYLGKY